MSAPVDVLGATAEESSAVPNGMTEVSREEFWAAVHATELNVHPSSERHQTYWAVVGTRLLWGWSSRGFAGPFEDEGAGPARFALARVKGGAA